MLSGEIDGIGIFKLMDNGKSPVKEGRRPLMMRQQRERWGEKSQTSS
jgi:hypothetical protein